MTNRDDSVIKHKNVEKANHQKNPFTSIEEMFGKYEKGDDFKVELKCFHQKEMNKGDIKWCFKLAERNVGSYYKSCALGWQPKVKQNDLNKSWARYLLAYEQKKLVAYAMFRFDMDYGRTALYCYEMQVDEGSQRKGLGEFMMKALERMAKIYSMDLLVLTVLKNNDGARRFYKRLGYGIDEMSPDKKDEPEDYEILSKEF